MVRGQRSGSAPNASLCCIACAHSHLHPKLPPNHGAAAACHLHHQIPSSWPDGKLCPVHGTQGPSLAAPSSHATPRVSVTPSASIASPTGGMTTRAHDSTGGFLSIDFTGEGDEQGGRGDEQGGRGDEGGGSWSAAQPEDDLKKACEELCEQIQWKSETHYLEVARSSFREVVHCQASLHALHEENVDRSRGDFGGEPEPNLCGNGYHVPLRSMLSLSQSHSPLSDATFARPFRECSKERPMSAPIHGPMRRVTSPGRGLIPEDLLRRYCVGSRVWTPQSRKGGLCVGSRGRVNPREDVAVPLHPCPSLRSVDHFRSKSAALKKPRFCTGLKRGKGETIPEDAEKRMVKVLPVIALHRDKAKGVWNRKANQKEWDAGHRGCCSQHWVSVLDKNEKVCHTEGRKLSARENLSPAPEAKFAEMATQKLQVQGERCRPQVARSLDLSSSPLSSLKAIVDDMSRPQSASLPKRISDAALSVGTPRSNSSTCRSSWKPSIAVPPARKLKNPELNSSAWLLAKMEALKNETFTEPKALQIAKEHGIVLDKEDEAALKRFLQSEQSPSPEHERNKPREKYFNLSNISTPAEFSVVTMRKVQKQLHPKACAVRIRDRPSTSDQCPQVSSKPGDLNLKNLNDELDWSDEESGWIERCREAHTTTNVYNSCHT